jgi:hypothetical protein
MQPLRNLPILFLLSVLAVGCGGGGGGVSKVNVPISTDWTTRGASGLPTGASERITVYALSAPTVAINTINQNAGTAVVATNVSVAPGKYLYHVDLYAGASETGAVTGTSDIVVDTSLTSSVAVAVGQPIAALTLGPSGTTVAVGATAHVYASPLDASGAYTFAAPGDISFSSALTSTLTAAVNSADGTEADLVGVTTGTTTVSAHATLANISSSPLSVSVLTTTGSRKKWTIMVFLDAANNLVDDALPNYLQMQQAIQGNDAQIVVMWKEFKSTDTYKSNGTLDWSFNGTDDTRYYLVQPSTGTSIVGSPVKDLGAGVDMGLPGTAKAFIAYCKANYPADRYVLDMWDHGDGWQEYLKKKSTPPAAFRGISYDEQTGHDIDSWVMDQCFTGGNGVDILAYDACEMQMLECAYQTRNYASYTVGSEDLTPGPGYDYSVALLPFFTNSTGATATLARGFVDQMINDTAPGGMYAGEAVCQSVVDSSKITAVAAAVDAFGSALLANKTAVTSIVQSARSHALRYDPSTASNMYFDAVNLATIIQNSSGVPSAVSTAAANVTAAVQASVLYNRYDEENLDANSNGLGVDFSNASTFNSVFYSGIPTASTQYAQLAFAQDYPHWYSWLLVAP